MIFTKRLNYQVTRVLIIFFSIILITGCATQPGEINNRADLTNDETILTGARQRAILNLPVADGSRPGLVNPKRIICAEPSPDVAIAIAQSMGFGVSAFGYGSGSLTGANAEGLAQIAERTVSIQLLRDGMYRACEAYANGAITGTTYNLIMSKNNDAMVTLMLAEVAGGAFGRKGASIATGAEAEAEASQEIVAELQKTLGDVVNAQEEADEAEEQVEEAEEDLEAAKAAAATDDAASETTQVANDDNVEESEQKLSKAKETNIDKNKMLAGAKAKAKAEVASATGVSGITSTPNVGIAQEITKLQSRYLDEDFADEFISACLIELGLARSPNEFSDWVKYTQDKLYEIQAQQIAHVATAFQDKSNSMDEKREALSLVEDALVQLRGFERRSALTDHCESYLQDFVVYAYSVEADLEEMRIRVSSEQRAVDLARVKNELSQSFEKSITKCSTLAGDLKTKCITAATEIISSDGIIQVGKPSTIISVPTSQPPYPLVNYLLALEVQKDYDAKLAAYNSQSLPAIIAAPASGETAAAKKIREAYNSERAALASTKTSLDTLVGIVNTERAANLDASGSNAKQTQVENFQQLRPGLVAKWKLAEAGPSKVAAKANLDAHDANAKAMIATFDKVKSRMSSVIVQMDNYVKAAKALNTKFTEITTAIAAAGTNS